MAWSKVGNIQGPPGPGGGGGSSVTISDTAPTSPAAGNIWVDSTTGIEYTYYNDGSSSQWVQFASPSGATSPYVGNIDGGHAASTYTTSPINGGHA